MLISEGYLDLQRQMHASPRGYGGKGRKWADHVLGLTSDHGWMSVLDYGCGQGSLASALRPHGLDLREYDPAIAGKDAAPDPAELVVCTDVLEHVEPEHLEAVLDDLARCARRAAFIVVSLVPAGKPLADGRDAHILLRPADWWMAQLGKRFLLAEVGPVRQPKGVKEFAALWSAL